MFKYAVNLSMLFTELPLIDRFAAAAKHGFSAVEIQFPYELTIDQIQQQLTENDLNLVLINFPAGNWAEGDRGIACDPDRVDEFNAGIDQALSYATALSVPQINCLSGIKPSQITDTQAEHTFRNNLQNAAKQLADADIELRIEAINTQDIPGFWLNNSQQAFKIIEELALSNLAFQYDIYHMQIMEGNLLHTLRENLDKVKHIQVADVPGRHEPGTGELNYPNIFKALQAMGYSGYVSYEYIPATTTENAINLVRKLEQ